jgi:hypothetical protein
MKMDLGRPGATFVVACEGSTRLRQGGGPHNGVDRRRPVGDGLAA